MVLVHQAFRILFCEGECEYSQHQVYQRIFIEKSFCPAAGRSSQASFCRRTKGSMFQLPCPAAVVGTLISAHRMLRFFNFTFLDSSVCWVLFRLESGCNRLLL